MKNDLRHITTYVKEYTHHHEILEITKGVDGWYRFKLLGKDFVSIYENIARVKYLDEIKTRGKDRGMRKVKIEYGLERDGKIIIADTKLLNQ